MTILTYSLIFVLEGYMAANSAEPDEVTQNVSPHLGLH